MLVKELRGTESTQDACAKMRVKHSLPGFISIIRNINILLRSQMHWLGGKKLKAKTIWIVMNENVGALIALLYKHFS